MTTPAAENFWELLNEEHEIVGGLKSIGVDIALAPDLSYVDQAGRDAMASILMRRQSEELDAIAQLEKSRELEISFIKGRYAAELDARRFRAGRLNLAACAVAEHTKVASGYAGKKKSRDVGAGTYGYKSFSECVELQDDAAYVAWAEVNAPETLRVKVTMKLAEAKEYLTPTELAAVKREVVKAEAKALAAAATELPAGFVRSPAFDEFYAKPLPAIALPGKIG